MGTYQLFHAGPETGTATGGMMNLSSPPAPCRLYHIGVEEIVAATDRLTAAGGAMIDGPIAVPGGMWVVQAVDPQGAGFALVGPRAGT